ncbi:hypothetical protein GBA52_015856 [Prunus armeniaca]|nr:hypothetical protein GBA52_015856 [Prunus armeniaca]
MTFAKTACSIATSNVPWHKRNKLPCLQMVNRSDSKNSINEIEKYRLTQTKVKIDSTYSKSEYQVEVNFDKILAGFDAAIEGGVDLLSFSFGAGPIPSLVNDITAIQKGILRSALPVNLGPFNGTVQNAAPWILTVGASTIDRSFRAMARFGNGEEFEGESLYQPLGLLNPTTLPPLVYPTTSNHTLSELRWQMSGTW